MSKTTGLEKFTKSGKQEIQLETIPTVAEGVVSSVPKQIHARSRAQKSVVAMSFRISRHDWERLHQLAIADGVSINTLTLLGLSKLFEERGLPGIVIN